MGKVKLVVKYELGHSYNETWISTDLYCVHCGKREVWEDESDGDYYVGNDYLCISCGAKWNLPYYDEDSTKGVSRHEFTQRLKCIRDQDVNREEG